MKLDQIEQNLSWFTQNLTAGFVVNLIASNPQKTFLLANQIKRALDPEETKLDFLDQDAFSQEVSGWDQYHEWVGKRRQQLGQEGKVLVLCGVPSWVRTVTQEDVLTDSGDTTENLWVFQKFTRWIQELDCVISENRNGDLLLHKLRGVANATFSLRDPLIISS